MSSAHTPNEFVAWPASLPKELVSAWKASAPDGLLRWFLPEDHHITLAFFGPLTEEARAAVAQRLAQCPPLSLVVTLGPLLALPRPERLSALSCSIQEGGAALTSFMQEHRDPLLACAGLPPEKLPPLPHLTIARPLRRLEDSQRHAVLLWARQVVPPALPLTLRAPALYTRAYNQGARQFRIRKA
jgi:2'-5' RNA ligase